MRKVVITSPAEYDRHEAELRFNARVDGRLISVTATIPALQVIREALSIDSGDPLVIYAASGQLLTAAVASAIDLSGDIQSTYLLSHNDVLRVTGTEAGMPHVPKPWKR